MSYLVVLVYYIRITRHLLFTALFLSLIQMLFTALFLSLTLAHTLSLSVFVLSLALPLAFLSYFLHPERERKLERTAVLRHLA